MDGGALEGVWLDVSLVLRPGLMVYPGDPSFAVRGCTCLDVEDPWSFNTSVLELPTHVGTHIDPPRHFIEGGRGVDEVDLSALIGRARVLDVRGGLSAIDRVCLEERWVDGVERVVFHTDHSARWDAGVYDPKYPHLTPCGAAFLLERGVCLVGIDTLSIEAPDAEGFPVHRALLRAGVVIVEGLDMRAMPDGDWVVDWVCLPLRIEGGDGGPARVVVRCVG